jgi:hypothetical protein
MREPGEPAKEPRLDRLGGRESVLERRTLGVRERLDRLETGVERSLDEVLTLADEEAEPIPRPPRLELPYELEARVGLGGDQASSAALARSAIFAKAAGS